MRVVLAGGVLLLLLAIAASTWISVDEIRSLSRRIIPRVQVHLMSTVTLAVVCPNGSVLGNATYVQREGESTEAFAERVRREHAVLTQTLCGG